MTDEGNGGKIDCLRGLEVSSQRVAIGDSGTLFPCLEALQVALDAQKGVVPPGEKPPTVALTMETAMRGGPLESLVTADFLNDIATAEGRRLKPCGSVE